MLWPIVLVLVFLWLLGLVLGISGAHILIIIALILTVSNLLLGRGKREEVSHRDSAQEDQSN